MNASSPTPLEDAVLSALTSLVEWGTAYPQWAALIAVVAVALIALIAARWLGGGGGAPDEIVAPPEAQPESAAQPERVESSAEPEPLAAPQSVEEVSEPAPAVPPSAPEPEALPPARPRLRERLARTSEVLVGRLSGLLSGRKVDAELLEELETLLFTADLGVATAEDLLDQVKSQASGADAELVRQVLRDAIAQKLHRVQPQSEALATVASPHVILVLGVNGAGKTTTIGKLAARYAQQGKKVVLGAGDTFRAAAIEQLQVWGERVGCEVIAGQAGGDPASVAFDTVKAAIARQADVAIIDTAGRLQTKKPLMEELGKIARVIGKDLPDAPHESLLVLDANTGQNAISQARLFTEVTRVTGLVLTKLDGTAKGGVIVGLADEFGIPVKLVGVGEGIEDLRDFDADDFVDALFEPAG
jgi:fused signal recognition particle receptor